MKDCTDTFERGYFKTHFMEKCQHATVICQDCELSIKLRSFEAGHNCKDELKIKVKELQARVNELEEKFLKKASIGVGNAVRQEENKEIFNRPNQSGSTFYKLNNKLYCGLHRREMVRMNSS